MSSSEREDLYLLILLPANDAARTYCHGMEPSRLCEIQTETNQTRTGVIYTHARQENYQRWSLSNLVRQGRVKIKKECLLEPMTTTVPGLRNIGQRTVEPFIANPLRS